MGFINTKEIEKELTALAKYFKSRKLSFGEVGMLLNNYMSYAQREVQKEMMKKQQEEIKKNANTKKMDKPANP